MVGVASGAKMRILHNHEIDGHLHEGCPNCHLIRFRLSPVSQERWGIDVCTRGHPWEDTGIINSQGHRICRVCREENKAKARART
jgi:hypothetical protein